MAMPTTNYVNLQTSLLNVDITANKLEQLLFRGFLSESSHIPCPPPKKTPRGSSKLSLCIICLSPSLLATYLQKRLTIKKEEVRPEDNAASRTRSQGEGE